MSRRLVEYRIFLTEGRQFIIVPYASRSHVILDCILLLTLGRYVSSHVHLVGNVRGDARDVGPGPATT